MDNFSPPVLQLSQPRRRGQANYVCAQKKFLLKPFSSIHLFTFLFSEVVMARIPRLLVSETPAVYHVISRTALDGLPFNAAEKDHLQSLLARFSKIYFTEIIGYCLMDNHFHLLIRMFPEDHVRDEEMVDRYKLAHGEDARLSPENIPALRKKWSSLSELIKEIKQTFSRYYNKRHSRKGYLWGERFKSVIVQNGRTLIHCLAYIDLNPVRAGIVQRPEDYRWSSLGHHAQTGNRDTLLSLDFGLAEWDIKHRDRFQMYRKFVYETGAIDTGKGGRIDPKLIASEKKKGYRLTLADRLRFKTRYFTDAGIIGSQEFVAEHFHRFRDHFTCTRVKKPQRIEGLSGVFSLKRLSNT